MRTLFNNTTRASGNDWLEISEIFVIGCFAIYQALLFVYVTGQKTILTKKYPNSWRNPLYSILSETKCAILLNHDYFQLLQSPIHKTGYFSKTQEEEPDRGASHSACGPDAYNGQYSGTLLCDQDGNNVVYRHYSDYFSMYEHPAELTLDVTV